MPEAKIKNARFRASRISHEVPGWVVSGLTVMDGSVGGSGT